LWPTTISNYGEDLVVGLYEGLPSTSNTRRKKSAKLAFCDAIADRPYRILWDEFPDDMITALSNVNGVLRIASGQSSQVGLRISTYVGGFSIQENIRLLSAQPTRCLLGQTDQLVFSSSLSFDNSGNRATVYSLGIGTAGITGGLFSIMPITGTDNASAITSLAFSPAIPNQYYVGWSGSGAYGIDKRSTDNSHAYGGAYFFSQIYRIGQRFKITKIRIPLNLVLGSGMTIVPSIFFDDASSKRTLTTINSTTFPNTRSVVLRPENCTGDHNFFLSFNWTGTEKVSVVLPVTIEYELLDD
jgi:hypothetical protein